MQFPPVGLKVSNWNWWKSSPENWSNNLLSTTEKFRRGFRRDFQWSPHNQFKAHKFWSPVGGSGRAAHWVEQTDCFKCLSQACKHSQTAMGLTKSAVQFPISLNLQNFWIRRLSQLRLLAFWWIILDYFSFSSSFSSSFSEELSQI